MAGIGFSYRKYIAVMALQIVLVMTVLDVTLVNVALPVLAEQFHISNSTSVWMVTIYQLVITMLLLPVSSIGDLHSYKRTFLTGVVIFTLSSALCAASQNFTMVVVSRAIQGIGAACVMGVNIALVRLIYPREILGRGMALNAMCIAIATAAGPTIAGAILSVASWHWLFLINIPLGIIAFFIGWRLLPQNPKVDHKPRFDWISAVENMIVFGFIFYALGNFARKGDLNVSGVMLLIGIVVGIFYLRRQFGHSQPLLPVDLFTNSMYAMSILTSVCSFIAQTVTMIALPFMYLNSYHFSAITTGLLMTPWPLATMIVSPIAARYVERHNPGATAAVGMGVFILGVVLLLFPGNSPAEWNIAWRMAICGVGFGMFQTPNNIVMVMATPVHRTGGAGGMQSTARLVGQTLGATLVSTVFALVAVETNAVRICLYISICFATCASVFSYTRTLGHKKELHM
ncbi:MAG: MFS transporter [Muribaculaceae bacterium]|nr:MFS transporter [Muribaculaceae bacterium]MDE6795511.1 MFS transporter [Muribaculaceae bacterium]